MTSKADPEEAYVWVWLPDAAEPVVAGVVSKDGDRLVFRYGRNYRTRAGALPLYEPELPLRSQVIAPKPGLRLAGCLRDGAPDAWGRRVIIYRRFGLRRDDIDVDTLDELSYLLESGSDRIGALDFQRSPTLYEPRGSEGAPLDQLMHMAELVESGEPIDNDLEVALFHGSAIGGARPKALIQDGDQKLIAKFSSSTDHYDVVKAEFVAMRLAKILGLRVAAVRLVQAGGRDVLMVERFDRTRTTGGWCRRAMVSALTLFELDELMARYASYERLAEIVRYRFRDPDATLRELFSRLIFNVLCGNTDDHARNHAAFSDGASLELTPAYDICPQRRTGGEATQAMLIMGNRRESRLGLCLAAAPEFHLHEADAIAIIQAQVDEIRLNWDAVCDEAQLPEVQRRLLWRRTFLNPYVFQEAPAPIARLAGS